uniref:dnaJ homolog subfamily C member 11 n=1 Tax=Myxine glutinosa TaxID=7769 RepID=UPI00358E9AD8
MAAPIEEQDEVEDGDFYSLLNVRREATQEELKAAYRRLCMVYHPDKHASAVDKRHADAMFTRLHRAYEVLSDPQTRAIYDIYGKRGLDMEGWEVAKRTRTQAEVQDEFEQLKKEREERRLQQRTNPKGTVLLGLDLTDLFDSYDDEDGEYTRTTQMEVNRMAIAQSIEAPISLRDAVSLAGSLSTQNGTGGGSLTLVFRRLYPSWGWAEADVELGDVIGPTVGLKVHQNVSARSSVSCRGAILSSAGGMRPGITCVITRRLAPHTTGSLTWRWGVISAMNTSIIRDTESSHLALTLQLGVPNSFVLLSGQYKGRDENRTRLKASLRVGVFGTVLEYGAERKISRHSILGASVSLGLPHGVHLRLRLNRASQLYTIPMHLASEVSPSVVLYATVTPLLAYLALDRLVIQPYLRSRKEREVQEQRENRSSEMQKHKEEAEAAVRLMQETVRRNVEAEEAKMGLVVMQAWYGRLVLDASAPGERARVIDVTAPLQCLVRQSKLVVTEASKVGMPGFYDPCVGEEKSLKVLYQFRGVLHQVTVGDAEPLKIPRQSHRIDS